MSQLADNFVFAEFLDVWGPQASKPSPSVSPSPTQTPRPSSVESQSSGYSSYDDPSPSYTPWSTASSPVDQGQFYPANNGYYAQMEMYNPQFYPSAPPSYGQELLQYSAQPYVYYGQPPQMLHGVPHQPQCHFFQRHPDYDVCFCSRCMNRSRKSYTKH